ncbi:MAG: nuclear transport factor 2 family protein [Chitinophagaceae bacterium]|nr:nuclear transport factor 2 family protein [Chitinophagaceae bacterium]HQX74167.1 nuclear transport factor 2 family protein [Chitinophagaceae bacterium]
MQTIHQKSYCRISFFLLLSFISFATTTLAQSKDVKKILAVLRLEEEYWSKGDIEGYVSLYAPLDSTRMILSKGAAYGKKNILAFYKKYWPREKMGTLVLDGESLERLSRKFYYVAGYFHVRYPDGKTIDGRYSSLMIKIKGKWYLYTDHSG